MNDIWCLPPETRQSGETALIDAVSGATWSYARLHAAATAWREALPGDKGLLFLMCRNAPEDVAALLGAISAGHTVALLDPALPPAAIEGLDRAYAPEWIIETAERGPPARRAPAKGRSDPIFPDTALLLSTSGSTGSPKMVRLTSDNLLANAAAIASVLDIRAAETGAAHLPLHYSYGLSVLTSHLIAGASLLLTGRGMMDAQFWRDLSDAQVVHLPGVPYHYQMMLRLGLKRLPLGSVRVLTQAGGGLAIEQRQLLWDFMDARHGHFHIMYGQTEAAPRMTTLSHADFARAPASVGPALPGTEIRILGEDGTLLPRGEAGLVEFRGPNVMLGYAERRADLARADEQGGVLATGDIGRLDDDGRLTLTGRAKRILKYVGLRINADELELSLAPLGEIAVVGKDDRLALFHVTDADRNEAAVAEIKRRLGANANLPLAGIRFERVDSLPRTDRGKIDYRALEGRL